MKLPYDLLEVKLSIHPGVHLAPGTRYALLLAAQARGPIFLLGRASDLPKTEK